ncbi:MAG: TRAP transporter small permease [Clostridiales bacterium]|nr:TRAP transporter small permease [Clostridiales bacterium]
MAIVKKTIYAANGYILKISLLLIFLMMIATVADVTGRMFIRPIPGIFELTRYSLGVIVFTSLGYSQIHKVHIVLDLVVSRFPAFLQRVIDVFIYLLALVTFSLAFWQMLVYAGRLYNSGLITTVLRIQVFPWVFVSAIAVLFFDLVLLVDLIEAIGKLKKGGGDK